MSLAGNLQKLADIKQDFRDVFDGYNVEITDDTLFETYPSLIKQIGGVETLQGVQRITLNHPVTLYYPDTSLFTTSLTVSIKHSITVSTSYENITDYTTEE